MDNTTPPPSNASPPQEQGSAPTKDAGTPETSREDGATQEVQGKGPPSERARFVGGVARRLHPRPSDPDKEYKEELARYEARQKTFFEFATAQRNQYITAQAEQAKTYDQTILTFSAGAIALSITFIEKIAPNPSAPYFLYLAWGAFALAVLSVIVSFVISQVAFDREIQRVDLTINAANAGAETPPPLKTNRYTTATWLLNICSGASFVAGIAFFVLFGIYNWPSTKPVIALPSEKRLKVEFSGEVVPEKLTVTEAATASSDKTPRPDSRPPQPSGTQTMQPQAHATSAATTARP